MAPEIGITYIAGIIPSIGVSIFHYRSQLSKINSPPYKMIQNNLMKINKFWADYSGEIQDLTVSNPENDFNNFKKGLLLSSYIFVLLSWIGFFFHLIVFYSLRNLARPIIERHLLNSDLSKKNLSKEEVLTIAAELASIC